MSDPVTKVASKQYVEVAYSGRLKCFAKDFIRTVWQDKIGKYAMVDGARISLCLIKGDNEDFWRGSQYQVQ